jgi:hypothetical protein
VLKDLARWVEPGGHVFITVYEGDKTSRGKRTTKGWQAHRPAKNYMREIRKVFSAAWVHGSLIICEVGRK